MTGVRWACFLPAALLWLPAGVAAALLARIFPLPVDAGQWWVPVAAMPCGLPLAGAWLALRRAGWRGTAWAVATYRWSRAGPHVQREDPCRRISPPPANNPFQRLRAEFAAGL